jgi:hypothetical protein
MPTITRAALGVAAAVGLAAGIAGCGGSTATPTAQPTGSGPSPTTPSVTHDTSIIGSGHYPAGFEGMIMQKCAPTGSQSWSYCVCILAGNEQTESYPTAPSYLNSGAIIRAWPEPWSVIEHNCELAQLNG